MTASSLRILVVDDHRDTLNTLEMALRIEGHRPKLADSTAQALAMARRRHFDALLIDVHMPGMDGCQLVAQLAAENRLPPRAISMSAGVADGERARSESAGCYCHLRKPFKIEQLEAVLR